MSASNTASNAVEDANLPPATVDLVTVAMAVHWFDFEPFYSAVRRVLVSRGVLAVWGYHLPVIEPAIDRILERYYRDVLRGYWSERMTYVDEHYRTLPFPFDELAPPELDMRADWELDQLAGFLTSWSATQRYREERGRHPVSLIWSELTEAWGAAQQQRRVRWPLYLRVGRAS